MDDKTQVPAVDDWARARASHADLSPVDLAFREAAAGDPELLGCQVGTRPEEAAFRSPRQPWPLFISPQRHRELADASIAVSRLFRTIPEKLFDNDAERMAAFYGEDPAFIQVALMPPNGIADGLSRSDFIASESGFKCAEFNFGGNLGGLDNGLVARLAMATPAIRRFIKALGRPVRHRDPFRFLVRYVVRQVLSAGMSAGEVNSALLLSFSGEGLAALGDFFTREHDAILAAIGPPLRGKLLFCATGDFTAEGVALYRSGTRVHAVIENTYQPDVTVFRCFKAGSLRLYNGPLSRLLSDKRNLALLSENAESEAFTAAERAVIARHIPWSRCLAPGRAAGPGALGDLERLALARRGDMVLKKASSFGGADVILGRETSQPEWEDAIRRALSAGDWILQEHVESRPYLFQHGNGCRICRLAWGPYVFGDEYGGTFLRVQPEESGGIVNAARGATRACLLEVEDPPTEPGRESLRERAAPEPPPGSG